VNRDSRSATRLLHLRNYVRQSRNAGAHPYTTGYLEHEGAGLGPRSFRLEARNGCYATPRRPVLAIRRCSAKAARWPRPSG